MAQKPKKRTVSDRRQITLDVGIEQVVRLAEGRRSSHIDYRREKREERQFARADSAKVDRLRAEEVDDGLLAELRLDDLDVPEVREDASHFVFERFATGQTLPFLRGEEFREVVKILI